MGMRLVRRSLLEYFAGLGLSSTLLADSLCAQLNGETGSRITPEMLRSAAGVAGLTFTDSELGAMLTGANPTSLTFAGRVFGEAAMLAAARAYQEATDWHRKHPKM
jgi:hypothetical protein